MLRVTILLLCLSFSMDSYSRSVGMWNLMLWFNDGDYRPWEQNVRLTPLNQKIYNSYDYSNVLYTLNMAESMGVDYLILDDTNGVFRHNGNFDKTIKAYLRIIKQKKFKIKISIATGYEIYEKHDFTLFNKSINHLSRYFKDSSYYEVDGKPLIILYVNPNNSSIYDISQQPSNNKFISNDDKFGYRNYLKKYSIRYASGQNDWISDIYGVYGWKCKSNSTYASTMCVMPGWNRSHNQLTGSASVNRGDGDYYKHSWNNILEKMPENLVITSWDDWAEETAIAPTVEWGNTYIEITKDFISKFKKL